MSNDTAIFDAVRKILITRTGSGLTTAEVNQLNSVLHPPVETASGITLRTALELLDHEAVIQEAYKDSKNIWTWSVGITAASGVNVLQYKDNPQPMSKCLAAYVKLLKDQYGPAVEKAFGRSLTESQFAAALSFHYNTGAIGSTSWVKLYLTGDLKGARQFLETHYLNDGTLKKRRMAEAALFFDGVWVNDGKTTVLQVSKPSYQPNWKSAKRVDISADLRVALGI